MDAQSGGKPALPAAWGRALLAPVLGLVRPRLAAAWMAAAPRAACLLVAVLSLLIYAALLIFLMLWEGTVQFTWSSNSGFVPATDVRSFGRVWADWHATAMDGWFGPAELTLMMVLLLGPLLVLLLGWLSLPVVHRVGSVWRAYAQAVRASVLILSPLTLATAVCGTLFNILEHEHYRFLFTPVGDLEPGIVLFLCIAVSLWVLVGWLQRATAAALVYEERPVLPPRCEGCGYDLTLQPADGRCPECGLAIAASLVGEASRPGSRWAQRKTVASWLATSYEVLARPRAFYRRLRLRTPADAEKGFAAGHYVRLVYGAALWTGLMVVLSPRPPSMRMEEILNAALVFCSLVLSGLFGCWLGHRTIAAVVASWWLARRALPDTAWAAKIMIYETAFLWVFGLFWGALIGSFIVLGPWISLLAGAMSQPFFVWGMPIEVWFVAVGTLALGAVWLWRYSVAYRSIRWSNF